MVSKSNIVYDITYNNVYDNVSEVVSNVVSDVVSNVGMFNRGSHCSYFSSVATLLGLSNLLLVFVNTKIVSKKLLDISITT